MWDQWNLEPGTLGVLGGQGQWGPGHRLLWHRKGTDRVSWGPGEKETVKAALLSVSGAACPLSQCHRHGVVSWASLSFENVLTSVFAR